MSIEQIARAAGQRARVMSAPRPPVSELTARAARQRRHRVVGAAVALALVLAGVLSVVRVGAPSQDTRPVTGPSPSPTWTAPPVEAPLWYITESDCSQWDCPFDTAGRYQVREMEMDYSVGVPAGAVFRQSRPGVTNPGWRLDSRTWLLVEAGVWPNDGKDWTGKSVQDVIAWLRVQPGVTVTSSGTTTVPGRDEGVVGLRGPFTGMAATWLDVTLDPSALTQHACVNEKSPCNALFTSNVEPRHFPTGADWRYRFVFVPLPDPHNKLPTPMWATVVVGTSDAGAELNGVSAPLLAGLRLSWHLI